ncbi:Zn-ribbon domain-containing OB-fold protein [Anaerobranca gottschalkii]|uniref:DUF35 OB-fold domain-containing protein, acyl-CoA-associated n=1 Tax=Anaerobranca gottschalkii DSM 13577 TaxID=1120990 RepID=A0A1I0A0I8_9FIRM|nr:OB-fold domain-containing protein [Anaerobranca gottschalkii]SES87456.1 DUF35 OB-fold domain-containing protein, acyl-CoA-associated [Anaerobranca gottschalkii DSM 13577]
MSNKGRLYTYTIVNVPTEKFKGQTPYLIGIVEEGENRVLSKIEGYEEGKNINIGDEVDFVYFDEYGNKVYKLV